MLLLRRPSPARRKELAAAIWRPELRMAEVVVSRGKMFAYMGFLHGARLYLHPEEAV